MRQSLDKISTKILKIVPLLLSFVVPLFFLPLSVDYFAFNKYYFIAVLASVSLIAWCIRNLTRGKLHFTTSPALLPLVILGLANIISSVWLSSTAHTSLFGQTSLFISLVIIFITVTSSQKNQFVITSTIYGLISSVAVLSIITIAHYFGLTAKLIPSETLNGRFFNLTGSVLPGLAFTIPLLVATTIYVTSLKNWIVKSLLFASVLLMIVATIINISLILPQKGQPTISILPINAGWSIAVDTMKTWKTSLLGTGPETFLATFSRLRPMYLNLDNNIWNIRFTESSNYFFFLLTTTGLIGAISFLLSFIRPLFVALKNKRNITEKNTLYFLISALIVTILSFFAIPTGIVSLSLAFVLIIALTIQFKINNIDSTKDVTLSLSAASSTTPAYHDLPETAATTVTSSFLPWLIVFLSVALLSTYWFFSSKIYFASVAYKQAVTISQADPYNSFLKYQKAAQLDTYNPYYPQKLSQIYLTIANAYLTKEAPTDEEKKSGTEFAQRAVDAAKQSARLDTINVTAWENLFNVYKTLIPYADGAVDMAVSHGLQVAAIEPTNPAIYLQLGTLFYNLGDADQAIKFIDRSYELKQNWDLPYFNLSSIYKARKEYAKALQYAQAGLQYTDPNGENILVVQEEIKALEKLVPAQTASQSAVTQ